jgi:hypothetical protein
VILSCKDSFSNNCEYIAVKIRKRKAEKQIKQRKKKGKKRKTDVCLECLSVQLLCRTQYNLQPGRIQGKNIKKERQEKIIVIYRCVFKKNFYFCAGLYHLYLQL